MKKRYLLAMTFLVLIVGVIVRTHTMSIDWESGASHGGYTTHIFDKYSDELVQKYLNGSDMKDER